MTDDDRAREVFREIYASDHWQGGSGAGSNVASTDTYRGLLSSVIRAADVRSVVDAGCGDWQFSRLVDWSGVRYTGLDIVPELVEENRRAFGRPTIEFVATDIRNDALPRADLLVCKDVLQHWDIASIEAFLTRNLGRYRYALITNDLASVHCDPALHNAEIPIGHWRTLDLEAEPFGRRAEWHVDYDVAGEWTKRTVLYVRAAYRPIAVLRRGSALRVCRTFRVP